MKTCDEVIILGGGHNGLVCACNLAGVRAYGGVCPQRSFNPRNDPETYRQVTKLYASSLEGPANDSQEAA